MASFGGFTLDDFQLLDRYSSATNFGTIPDTDKAAYQLLRQRMGDLVETALAALGASDWHTHVSVKNPMGRTPKDFWCAIYPPGAEHKSFAAQIALIFSPRGVELCCCLGAGRADLRDPEDLARHSGYFTRVKQRIASLNSEFVTALEARIDTRWTFRKQWRLSPGAGEFSTLQDWLTYASGPAGDGASISDYLDRADVIGLGAELATRFDEAVVMFKPLLMALDDPEQQTEVITLAPSGQERATRWWAIAPGEGGRMWDQFVADKLMAIGWDFLGSLQQYTGKAEIAEALRAQRQDEGEPINDSLACAQFVWDIKPGDHVLAKRGIGEVLGYGVVESDYEYDPNRPEYKHRRRVRWLVVGPWSLPQDLRLPAKALTDVSRYKALLDWLQPLINARNGHARPREAQWPQYTIDDLASETFISRPELLELLRQLSRKKNLIVDGPPGTGKTFIARRLAFALLSQRDPARVAVVQFHQSYGYEEFMWGYRPGPNGMLSRERGVFMEFCEAARRNQQHSYVFIIDER